MSELPRRCLLPLSTLASRPNLCYYRARYYDPGSGRFLSEDPVRLRSGGTNFYVYAASNPNNFIDPLGLTPTCAMTRSGLVCEHADPVQDRVDSLLALFPSSRKNGEGALVIPLSCDKVNDTLLNAGFYTGGFFTPGEWVSNNPFLFWNPIHHRGGSEFRDRFGFHLRLKKPTCDKQCTLDQFHIDSTNPLYNSFGHFVTDFLPALGSKVRQLF